jgi:hypothetical protein
MNRNHTIPANPGFSVLEPYTDTNGKIEGYVKLPVVGWSICKEGFINPICLRFGEYQGIAAIETNTGTVILGDAYDFQNIGEWLEYLRTENEGKL